MSIETRIQAINDHLIDDYKVLQLAGTNLTNVDKNIVNLKPTWKERLLYFMNNGTDEVWNNWDKVNGSGTSLSLNNTEEAPMSLTYKGNTYQEGTPTPESPQDIHVVSGDNSINVCGKNLFDIKEFMTSRGATYIENSDGSISTDTNNSSVYSQPYVFSNTDILVSLNGIINNGTATNIRLQLLNSNNEAVGEISSLVSSSTNKNACKLRFNWSTSGTFTLKDIMLNLGTTATNYEPYQGSSYPISLSHNLFSGFSLISSGNVIENNKITFNNSNNCTSTDIEVLPSTTYYFSFDTSYTGGVRYYIEELDSTKTQVQATTKYAETSFTTTATTKYVHFRFTMQSSSTFPITLTNIQLEKGSSKTHYEEYREPIELCKIGTYQDKIFESTGKNYFDISKVLTNGTNIINNGNGTLSVKAYGTAGGAPSYLKTYCPSLQVGDSVILTLDTTSTNKFIYLSGTNQIWSSGTERTLTQQDLNSSVLWYSNNASTTNVISNIMIRKVGTSADYEEYTGGTGWYLKKEIGKDKLSSSNVIYHGVDNYRYQFELTPSQNTISKETVLSNYFKNYGNDQWWTYDGNILISNSNVIYMTTTVYTSITSFNNFTSSNDVYVYYPLATPTYETITDTTLLGQLEEAKKSYEEQTNISQVNNDLPFELEVVALGVM